MSNETRTRLLRITALANDYCTTLQQTNEMERLEFVQAMTDLLPRIYWEFSDFAPQNEQCPEKPTAEGAPDPDSLLALEEEEERYYGSYVDEDFYESIRRHVEMVLGPDDVFLETFEEDMKYSDTPIAASVSECLADIFQPLFNFISIVKDSEGSELEGAYLECRENFTSYWSQTLCNVLRPLNHIRFS